MLQLRLKRCLVLLGVLSAHPAAIAGAQAPPAPRQPAPQAAAPSLRFGITGGLALPAGDLGDAADAGAAIALRGESRLGAPRWSLRADLAVDRFGGRGAVDTYTYTSLAGNLVHHGRSGRAYAFGGLGVYHARTAFDAALDRSSTQLGVQMGVGAGFPARAPRWFAEAGLTSAFTSGRSSLWLPVRLGFWL
jgi:hypothetical protein